jgi:phosphohistidine phosphatase
MAAWLNRQLPSSARVLVSPARRTQQTAAALDRKFKTVRAGARRHGGSAAARRALARRQGTHAGGRPPAHAGPGRGLPADGEARPGRCARARVWWLRGRDREGELQVVLHAAMAPELL